MGPRRSGATWVGNAIKTIPMLLGLRFRGGLSKASICRALESTGLIKSCAAFCQRSGPRRQRGHIRHHHAGVVCRTIAAPSPSTTKPSDLLAHLPANQGWSRADNAASQNPLLLLLLTPSFTSLLRDDANFVAEALRKAFSKPGTSSEEQRCSVLAAVVDRLPRSVTRADVAESRLADIDSTLDDGVEGFGFMLAPGVDDAAPGLFQAMNLMANARSDHIEQSRCLSFAIDTEDRQDVVEIPLAGTLFQNGQASTMVASYWTRSAQSDGWVRRGRTNPSSQRIRIKTEGPQSPCQSSPEESGPLIGLPLMPLTQARQIQEGFGNIIRRLHSRDQQGSTKPASQELEAALVAHSKENGLPPQATTVWAMLYPGDKVQQRGPDDLVFTALDETQTIPDPVEPKVRLQPHQKIWAHDHKAFFSAGATLRRVLSGGGGWGQKQGLISLDPESKYAPSEAPSFPGPQDDQGMDLEKDLAIGKIARPGDWVQFMIPSYAAAPLEAPRAESSSSPSIQVTEGATKLVFDVVPSSSDLVGTPPGKQRTSGTPCSVSNHFGASSEKGLCYTTAGSANPEPSVTRIDVPYSKILIDY